MMKKTKILIDCHSFDYQYYQGVTTYLSGIYNETVKNNPDIEFYFASKNINKLKSVFGLSQNIFYLKYTFKSPIMRLIFELPFLILKNNIDYLHVQYKSPLLKFCKEIVTVHDVLFLDFPQYFGKTFRIINKFYYRFSSKRADILLTVSDYSAKRISKHFKININSIFITPNGIDNTFLNFSNNKNLIPDIKSIYGIDKYILYVSRIEPRKNHELVVKAYNELNLADENIKLVFVGFETSINKILNDQIKITDRDNIIKLTNISVDNLAGLYACSLFTVFPSFVEGFGIPPIESTVMGTPVILSNQTAMSDFYFIKDQMFDPNSIEEFKFKVKQALTGVFKDQTAKTEFVKKKYLWSSIGKKYSHIINNSK